jgi:integrase
LALQWSHVDLDRGTLAVVQTLEQTKAGLRLKPPKTKRSRRVVTLPSLTVEALRRHKADQAAMRLKLGMGKDDSGFVCARWDGELRSPRALTKEFARLIAKLDLPRISFHGLRHSHATHLLRAGVHPKVAQERLGHSTIATTMDLYSHVTATMQEDAAVRVDVALKAALGKRNANK